MLYQVTTENGKQKVVLSISDDTLQHYQLFTKYKLKLLKIKSVNFASLNVKMFKRENHQKNL